MDVLLALMVTVIPMTLDVAGIEYTKGLQLPLDKKTQDLILKEGIYHLTSRENALEIMKSGYLRPSKGKLNNHFAKSKNSNGYADFVYMFLGKPNIFMLAKNMAHAFGDKSDGSFYAIKHMPSANELKDYTQRFNDGALTYEGKLSLKNKNPEIVRFKLEKGKLVEIPMDEEYKMNPIKKKTLRYVGLTGLVLSTTVQIFGDLGRLSITKENRTKFIEHIRKYRLVNKVLDQYNTEKKLIEEKINKIAKKFGKDKDVALESERAETVFSQLDKVNIKDIKSINTKNHDTKDITVMERDDD